MRKIILPLLALMGALVCGCATTPEQTQDEVFVVNAKPYEVHAVVIGMETSKFAGACPGAGLDSDKMYQVISRYANSTILLQNANATKGSVVASIEMGIERSENGLFILYYSGHGGSSPFPDTGIEEIDGKDEYLCLYDTYLRDNEIWNMICKSKGRVFIITDSCHSQTQFRNPSFVLTPPMAFDHTLNEVQPFSMLCWSGCPDENYSYGSTTGGQFTNALLRHYKPNMTYQQLWDKIKTDKTLRIYENPQSTVIGNGFKTAIFLR